MLKIEVQVSNSRILHLDPKKFANGVFIALMAKFYRNSRELRR